MDGTVGAEVFFRFGADGVIVELSDSAALVYLAAIGDSFFKLWENSGEIEDISSFISPLDPSKYIRLKPKGKNEQGLWKLTGEYDDLGELTYVNAVEKKEIEKEFFRDFSEIDLLKYIALFENSFAGVGIMQDNVFIAANKRMLNIFGYYSLDDFVTKTLWDHIHPENRKMIREKMLGAVKSEEQEFFIELPVIRKDGEHRDVEMSFSHIKSREASFLQIVARDVTLHKQAYKSLHRSEALFRAFMETAHFPVFMLDVQGSYVYASENIQKKLGYTPGDVIGKKRWFSTETGNITLQKAFDKCVSEKRPVKGLRVSIKKANGRYITVNVSFSPVFEKDRSIRAILMQTADVTGAGNKAALSDQLESSGRIAGRVAHDFNNLLQIIVAHVNFLQYSLEDESPLNKNVDIISKVCSRATALTRQLLAYSRKRVMKKETMDLKELLDKNRDMFAELGGENLKITMELGEEPSLVFGDPEQLEDAFFNIVINSREAVGEQGILDISIDTEVVDAEHCEQVPEARPGNYICVEFSDNGTGISPDDIMRIYEPFFSTKNGGEGSGMGLSVSYGIISQHDGWMEVKSETGEGTDLKIFLPAKKGAVNETAGDDGENQVSLEGVRVLYVEDEEDVRIMTRRALLENGMDVVDAESAEEALEKFKESEKQFDIVFSDVVLPGMNGYRLCEEIKSIDESVGVLFCSGYADEKSQKTLIENKGYGFLQKPYVLKDILKAFKELMKK